MPDQTPDFASFTTVFRASDTRRTKRNRQAVSCLACQKRKSRCDRRQPCSACEKRSENCRFGVASHSSSASVVPRQEVQNRLTQLEELVKTLAEGKGSKIGDGRGKGLNVLNEEEGEGSYHGATSWAALVESIHDIQSALEAEEEGEESQTEPSPQEAEPEIFMSDMKPVSTREIIKTLPSKQDADRLISSFFKSKFVAMPLIHTHYFRRKYEAFWENPYGSDLLWVSILFSILSIGAQICQVQESPVGEKVDRRAFVAMSGRCLVSGQYLKPKPLSVEALLLHAHMRNVQKEDSDYNLWSLHGLAVRLAQRRGYHREPAKVSSKISAFEAEMRRRTWFMVSAYDVLFSFQQGMPPMIYDDVCDTEPPSCLLDDDFDEDTLVLPPPRSPTDPLPILATFHKARLCPIMRAIIYHALSVRPKPYSATLQLNDRLQAWHKEIPPCLRIRSIKSTSFTDPNYTIMHRIMLEVMYRKSLCVLHRPYLSATEDLREEAEQSRTICREAALVIMEVHIEIDREIQPGGRMYEDRYMFSSLTLHDFLIAAMVICLDLSESTNITPETRTQRISLLRTAHQMWTTRSATSFDASHAAKVLRAILNRIETPAASSPESALAHDPSPATPQTNKSVEMATEHPIVPTLENFDVNYDEIPELDSFFANTDVLDWNGLDRYLRHDVEGIVFDEPMPDLVSWSNDRDL